MTTSAPRAGTLADLLTAEALVFPPKDDTPFDWLDERVNATREHAAALASLINWLDRQEKELAIQLTADLTPDDVATRRPYNFGPDQTPQPTRAGETAPPDPDTPPEPPGKGIRLKQIAWLDEPDTDGQLDRLIEAVRSWPQRRRTGAETKRYLGQVLALRLTAPVLQQVVTMEHYHHGTKLEEPLVTYVIHARDKPKPTYTNWRPDVVSPLAYDCEQACWESIRRNAAHVRRLLRAQAPRQVELEIQGIRSEIHFLARIEERIHEIAYLREEEDGWVANEDPDNDYHKYGSSLSGSVIRAIEDFMDVLEPEGDYCGDRVNDDDPDPPTGLLLAVRDPDLLRMCVRCLRSLHPFEAKHIARVMASDLSFDENCTGDDLARFQEALQQPVEHYEKFSPRTITRQGERNNVGMGPRRAP